VGCIVGGAAAVGGGAILAPIIAPVLLAAGIPVALAPVILATTQPVAAPLGSMLTVKATNTLAVLTGAPGRALEQSAESEAEPVE